MTSQPETVSRPSRRFLRVSVRGLIVLVLVVGGWLGWIVRSARIQRDALAVITRAGGSVEYDSGWIDNEPDQLREPWAPEWAVCAFGIDYFAHVHKIYLTDLDKAQVTDATLAHVSGLTKLASFDLRFTRVTDEGLASLKAVTCLSDLSLAGTEVTAAGLAHLSCLTNLSNVDLRHTRVTDAGLAHLNGLSKLKWLGLGLE